jgi:hypothetical protein
MLCKQGKEHITFQTAWMFQRLLDCGKDGNNVYSGGLISDVTYQFFTNGYLIKTSMYCNNIGRWIPVQLIWICGLSKTYYSVHLTNLFRQFLIPSLLQHKRKNMARSIVDFSKAQQSGFVLAYMNVFGEAVIMADKQVSFPIFNVHCNSFLTLWLKNWNARHFLKPSAWHSSNLGRKMAPPTKRR